MSAKSRFLSSVSGFALTAALATFGFPAMADTVPVSGTVAPPANQNNTGASVVSAEAESSDPQNTVTVTGLVTANGTFNHLNSIGVHITGWDIEASGAYDDFIFAGAVGGALASNAVVVEGAITGTIGNLDFAPGSGSYGVLVADDIEAEDAYAEVYYYDFDSAVSLTAQATNTIAAAGSVAGSSLDSYGVRVDGDVRASFATARIDIFNDGPTDAQASGSGQALNAVGITGLVGGEQASDGSVGFYVAGDVYASNAAVDGSSWIWIPQLNSDGYVATVASNGLSILNIAAANTATVVGAVGVGNDGGADATGVFVGGDVYATDAYAAGEAISVGGEGAVALAYGVATAQNLVTITGEVGGASDASVGVLINGDVFAEGATAFGQAIARDFDAFPDDSVGGESTTADFTAVAGNAVSISGISSTGDATGVHIGGDVYAHDAAAGAFAGANPYEQNNEFNAIANAVAQASNSVAIAGTVTVDDTLGVYVGEGVSARIATAEGWSRAHANYDGTAEEAPDPETVTAESSAVSGASNAVSIVGTVGDSVANSTGVDPIFVTAQAASAYGGAVSIASAVDGLGSTATAEAALAATNAVVIGATIGNNTQNVLGVYVEQYVSAAFAYADGEAYAEAIAINTDSLSDAGASATAGIAVNASNVVVIGVEIGNDVANSEGVYVGYYTEAYNAYADGFSQAYATVDGGAAAVAEASAELAVAASNVIVLGATIGANATDVTGIDAEGVWAGQAWAGGYAEAYATNNGSSGGDAIATADGVFAAGNTVVVAVEIGDGATNVTGIRANAIEASNAMAEGYAYAQARVIGDADSTGAAQATATSAFSAVNQAIAVAGFGDSENVFGVYATDDLSAYDAQGSGEADAWVSLYGGIANDATADADNLVGVGNQVQAAGLLGDENLNSVGVWIGEGVSARFADGRGRAYATVYAGGNSGDAIATATNNLTAFNAASVQGIVGGDSVESTGVYVAEGIAALQAVAEGYARAEAATNTGDSLGDASATAAGSVVASNTVSISGIAGDNGSGNTGVLVDDQYVAFLQFGSFFAAGGAAYARANSDVDAQAAAYGGIGSAIASGSNDVMALNMAVVGGVVGNGATASNGVVFDEGGFVANDAYAEGWTDVYAEKGQWVEPDGSGDALADANGQVVAANIAVVGGTIGDDTTESYGVAINDGGVLATLARADASFAARAERLGDEAGNATAAVGTSLAPAAVAATNVAALDGFTSGTSSGFAEGAGLNNIAILVEDDVVAAAAFAEGGFDAVALREGSGAGTATASLYGEVVALNAVSITGGVGTSATGGLDSTGIAIDGEVVAANAVAYGTAYSTAELGDLVETGDATSVLELAVSASNQIAIAGVVGSGNIDSTGVAMLGEGASVFAEYAFASGEGIGAAVNNGVTDGLAASTAGIEVSAVNAITISGEVESSNAMSSGGVVVANGVVAVAAFGEGFVTSTAERNGDGNGAATATATGVVNAANVVLIEGTVGSNIDDFSVGVMIGEGVNASFAEGSGYASAVAERNGDGEGIATAIAANSTGASNLVVITGSVGVDTWNAYGVDPQFVNASEASATSVAAASASSSGAIASATATAVATNDVILVGQVDGDPTFDLVNWGSTGLAVVESVTARNASATAQANLTLEGAGATGTVSVTATARNLVAIEGIVGPSGDDNIGVEIGGDVVLGGLSIDLSAVVDVDGDASAVVSGTGTMTNIAAIDGAIGDQQTDSDGVYIGGSLVFEGDNIVALTVNQTGTGASSALLVVNSLNVAAISGAVGSDSTGSHGVHIEGDISALNGLVSNIVVVGADATNDGTTRGVWIGGSILTDDRTDSLNVFLSGHNTATPDLPDPLQIGDYVELAGSVYIGANGGLNPHGVAVGDGDDTVLVRDTDFQMEVVNGFDGGPNPTGDGQDHIIFDNARIYVSNIDNFELLDVLNNSMVILTNPTPYIYSVRDESNVAGSSILAFGDGAAQGVNSLQFDTAILTIGGIAGVKTPGPGIDDSILKAENNGAGSYEINADVFNFGTITLSKVLSTIRGTDPDDLTSTSATSFDDPAEQQFWALTGSWALDPTSAAGDRLVINGNYTAGSDIIVDAFVFNTGSASDVVVINGDVAGVTTIWVNNTNAFGPGAVTGNGPTDGILLVDVNNAQDPAVVGAAFVLGNSSGWNWVDPVNFPDPEMQVGAFIYNLRQGGNDGRDFYLQSSLLDQVPVYTVMSSAIQQHFYAELGTLYQRMGELRHADTGSKANSSFFEFWLRAYGQDVEMNPKHGFDFDMTSKGFMIGGDYAVRNWVAPQSRLHLGGFAGYGWTKLDNVKGASGNSDGKTDGFTVGVYATYFDTAKKGQGFYADFVGKLNFLDSEYTSSTRNTKAKSDDFAWGVSLEAGYGIGLGGGFIVQPQGQLSYMETSKEKFREKKSPGVPLEIERDGTESLRGRLGLQLQNTFMLGNETQFSPYVIGNVLHEFLGDNRTKVAGTEFRNDMGGTWFNAGAGFTLDFDNVGLYGHVEYNFGNRIEGLAAGLGVKVKLGGSSPVAAAPVPPPPPPVVPKTNYIVFFDFDRSNITADAQRVIDEAATAAKAGNSTRVQLTGHTDRAGSEQYNMALSLRRGEAVKQALIARGIPANAIVIIGRGESQPLVPTADGVREPQNRRVEIVL